MKEVSALMAVLVHDFAGDPIDAEEGARDVACGGGGIIHAWEDYDELPHCRTAAQPWNGNANEDEVARQGPRDVHYSGPTRYLVNGKTGGQYLNSRNLA